MLNGGQLIAHHGDMKAECRKVPSGKYEIHIMPSKGRRSLAIHTRYYLTDNDGKILGAHDIDKESALEILHKIKTGGLTKAFYLPSKCSDGAERTKISAEEVRHQKTVFEQSFTATGEKLGAHWPIFKKYNETGFGSIVRATMTLHQICSSRCPYCSTIARNNADSISLEEAQTFVDILYQDQAEYNKQHFSEYNDAYRALHGADIRLRGLILSGGGQPNIWPHFVPFVEWLRKKDIDLGLITNGFPKLVPEEVYSAFTWVRISITPENASPHYVDNQFNKQYIPEVLKNNKDISVGLSYVHGPWTDNDIIKRIVDSIEDNGFTYCRILTDCNLSRQAQLRSHQELAERLYKLDIIESDGTPKGKIFHQLKYHGTKEEAFELWDEGQCYLQSYNVFWDTTDHDRHGYSYCYPCDSVTVLTEENEVGEEVNSSERRFNYEKWGTVKNTQVDHLYTKPVTAFFDPRENCQACLFMKNNRSVKALMKNADQNILVDKNITHINFP